MSQPEGIPISNRQISSAQICERVLARAAAAASELPAHAAESERQRRLTDAAEAVLRNAGLFRITVPRSAGGFEAGPRALSESVRIVTRAYPSAGWVLAVYSMHTWMAAQFPKRTRDEVFAGGPDVRIAGGLAHQGAADPVDGGWRISGRWQFVSGVPHSDWMQAGASVTVPVNGRRRQIQVLIPRSELVTEDTWHTLGLRGTGSYDVILKDVFVPSDRAMSSGTIFRSESPFAREHETGFYTIPAMSALSMVLASAMLGMAERIFELYVEQMKPSTIRYTGDSKAERAETQMRLSESDGDIGAARLVLNEVLRQMEELMASGENASVVLRARLRWQLAYAAKLCKTAAERMFAGAGARATFDSSELQRFYRDINQASHHATIDPEVAAQIHGRVSLGLAPASSLI